MRPGWFDLPRGDRRAIVVTAMLVPVAHVLVRVCSYRWVMGVAERTAARWPARHGALASPAVIDQLRLATTRLQRYSPLPGNCLSRSLVLWWQLRRRGLAPALRLGASLAGGVFAAHAWVEYNGQALTDTPDVTGRYAPLT